ncbi:hypothetical protein GCM10010842_04380 [Deinococcus daejeonensis]|uniref:Uncharacterized protein n=1 Tax=Deinococcus daejeonensis TaxID=1007098 RepID=A0ABQ2IWW7_9DEIO|nr:hypothetical protein GCM10010842_04380 [Deinococcus daejeonensis]
MCITRRTPAPAALVLECSPFWEALGFGIKTVWDGVRQSLEMASEPGTADPDSPADAAV